MKRYERNRIYISEEEQREIKGFRVLLGGAGIGSNIAETILRLGFEHITIVDGDVVEESNLNRQNYKQTDLGCPKVEALKQRLLGINPRAKITAVYRFIDHENIRGLIEGHDVAINALDFKSDIPFLFDRLCSERGIYVLHPYNVGFAGIVMVMKPGGMNLESLLKEGESHVAFEKLAVRHVTDYFNYWVRPKLWIEEVIQKYEAEKEVLPPPQLSIASSLVAGMCASILLRIATGTFVKVFPKFYYYSEYDDLN